MGPAASRTCWRLRIPLKGAVFLAIGGTGDDPDPLLGELRKIQNQ